MRRPIIAIVLAALLVLSGCSALSPGDGGTTTVPPTTDDSDRPSWASNGDLYSALTEANRNRMGEAKNFTAVIQSNSTLADPDVEPRTWRANQTRVIRLDLTTKALLSELWIARPPGSRTVRTTFQYNRTAYMRTTQNGELTYNAKVANIPFQAYVASYSNLTAQLQSFDLRYDGTVTRNGRTLHVVVGTEFNGAMAAIRDVTSARSTAYVTEGGRIVSIEQTFEGEIGTLNSGPTEVRIDTLYRIQRVNQTTVVRPPWVTEQFNVSAS